MHGGRAAVAWLQSGEHLAVSLNVGACPRRRGDTPRSASGAPASAFAELKRRTPRLKRARLLIWSSSFLATVCAAPAAAVGPGEAAGSRVRRADLEILVWYRRADPLGTFKYQVYDVRKGQYTAAVGAWVDDIRKKHPAYIVIVRDLDLKREPGETESLKVGSVIKRELMVAAAFAGIIPGAAPNVGPGPFSPGIAQPARLQPLPRPLSNDRTYLAPNPAPFPFPYPYPRPHP